MENLFQRTAMTACPACGYDLAGAVSLTCPECGYTITAEDLESDTRRRVFLELTQVTMWLRLVVLGLVAVTMAYGLPLVLLGTGIGAGFYLVRGEGGLWRRMRLRGWLLAVGWLQFLWAVPLLVRAVWNYLYWETSLLDALGPMESGPTIAVAGLSAVVGPVLWRLSWRRSCLILGVPREGWFTQRERRAVLLAYAPQGAIVSFFGVVAGVVYALDRCWPAWYMD